MAPHSARGEGRLDSLSKRYARWVSSNVENLYREAAATENRINQLPRYEPQYNLRAGFHSRYASSAEEAQWVQVDLGASLPIEMIALVPACVQLDDRFVNGFGFPKQFRVEVSENFDGKDATLLFDSKSHTLEPPAAYPLLLADLVAKGRYVRVTCTELPTDGEHWFFALSELLVVSGKRNVACWRPVASSGAIETDLRWSAVYLVDAISALPIPAGLTASPSDGYLSAPQRAADAEQWVEIDLGQLYPVEEVQLHPARPLDQPDVPGWGFPSSFTVQLKRTADDEAPVTLYDCSQTELRHWLHLPLVIPVGSRQCFLPGAPYLAAENPRTELPVEPIAARYVRLNVQRLDSRSQPFVLALAEIQVYTVSENVALHKPVTASSVADENGGSRWSLSFLNDGYGSRRELLELPHWLRQINERRQFERRLASIEREIESATEIVWRRSVWIASSFLALALCVTTGYGYQVRRTHRRQTERLRQQIASDLHDDIGSNLGTIALLCETLASGEPSPERQETLREIREIAMDTGDAMRDIIWIMAPEDTRLEDFVSRLRQMATRLLPNHEVSVDCVRSLPASKVPLSWRRNVFLALKELLHNIAKHARAKQVKMTIDCIPGKLLVTLRDDGVGMGPSNKAGKGLGIKNVQRRLADLGGSMTYSSEPGGGATSSIQVPIHR
jgi:signal transduction histidine kinase